LFPFREWEHLGIKKADHAVGEIGLFVIPSLYNPGFEVGVVGDQINHQNNQKNDFPVVFDECFQVCDELVHSLVVIFQ
jgi:hypothetical protein